MSTVRNSFDEVFDNMLEEQYKRSSYSQYDYFVYFFSLLSNSVGNVPKILDKNDSEGIVLMEYVGDVRCKEFLSKYPKKMIKMYQRMIDWLIKFSKLDFNDKMIKSREYTTFSMQTEIDNFKKSVLNWMCIKDRNIFTREISKLLDNIDETIPNGICFRDFQIRNIMYFQDNLYIIDAQDICVGPKYYDLASLLYDSNNIVMTESERKELIQYYHRNAEVDVDFNTFYDQIKILGVLRLLKGYGVHSKYFIIKKRWLSQQCIENTKKIVAEIFETDSRFNAIKMCIDRYGVIPIILAAGKGSRMKSNLPKTLCEIKGKAMLFYILGNTFILFVLISKKK